MRKRWMAALEAVVAVVLIGVYFTVLGGEGVVVDPSTSGLPCTEDEAGPARNTAAPTNSSSLLNINRPAVTATRSG